MTEATDRLVLFPRVWQTQIPALARTGRPAVGYVVRNDYPGTRELVVREVRPLDDGRTGRGFGPLDDLLLVDVSQLTGADAAERLLDRFAPGPRQLVVALVVGHGPAAGRWSGAMYDEGRRGRLPGFTLVGPGMRRVDSEPLAAESAAVLERWSRTRGALTDAVWRKVRDSTVAVVGAGRNGSAAAATLAMLGVRRLVLIDGDREQRHNLDADVGSDPTQLGRPKVLARAGYLLRLRPDDLAVMAVPWPLPAQAAVEALRPADVVVTCVDRDAPRLVTAGLVSRWGKVHLDVGTGVFRDGDRVRAGADVRLLLPGEACVCCLGGLRDAASARLEAAAPAGVLRPGPRRPFGAERAGSLVTVNQVAVNLGVQAWLDLLAGVVISSCWIRVDWRSGIPGMPLMTTPASACHLCRPGVAA